MKDVGRGVLFPERMELDVFKRQKEPRSELEWRGGGNNVGAEVGGTGGQVPGSGGHRRKPLGRCELESEAPIYGF